MESKMLTLIINPHSGTKSKNKLKHTLYNKLSQMGYNVKLHMTRAPGHATELAAAAAKDGSTVVAVCGGDGTVNEAATGLCGTDTPMAIIPSGSGNGLARHLGIPIDEMMSLSALTQGRLVKCDCGEADGRKFFCTAGMGFDAHIAVLFAKKDKRGPLNYLKLMLDEFAKYHPKTYRITIDGDVIERKAALVTVCNASQYGNNAFIAPEASVSDGMLDVVVLNECSNPAMVLAAFDVMMGNAPNNKHIETFRASAVAIEAEDKCPMHLDGEPIENAGPKVEFRCRRHALNVIAGTGGVGRITPFITPMDLALRQAAISLTKPFRFGRD